MKTIPCTYNWFHTYFKFNHFINKYVYLWIQALHDLYSIQNFVYKGTNKHTFFWKFFWHAHSQPLVLWAHSWYKNTNNNQRYSLWAVTPVSLTCTVISVDDGLLRTSTGCAGPSPSSTLYVDWLNKMMIAKKYGEKKNYTQSDEATLLL